VRTNIDTSSRYANRVHTGNHATKNHVSQSFHSPRGSYFGVSYSSMEYAIWAVALIVTFLFLALFAFWCKRHAKNRDPHHGHRHADVRPTAGRPTHANVLVTRSHGVRSHASRRNQRKSLNSLAKHVSEIQSLSKRKSRRSSKHMSQTRRASQSHKRKSSHSLSKPRRSSIRKSQSLPKRMTVQNSHSLSKRMSRRSSKHMSHSSKRNPSLSRRKSQSFSKSNKDKSRRLKSSTAHRHLKKAISEDRAKRAAKGLE